MGADETQIEASFCEAIRIAREQKSISLEKRAKAIYGNTAGKRPAGQEDTDSDYLFGDCSQRAVSRFRFGKSSVIKPVGTLPLPARSSISGFCFFLFTGFLRFSMFCALLINNS
jgi:hypothetical protein